MILDGLVVGNLHTNCYIVGCERTGDAMLIDPGAEARRIRLRVTELGVHVTTIVLTHFHFDHMLAARELHGYTGAPLVIHAADAPLLTQPPALFHFFRPNYPAGLVADQVIQDGDRLKLGDLHVQVLHTPGHSPGGISLWLAQEKILFSGDTLFREGVGRADFPGCSAEELLRSIRTKLLALPDDTTVYPGHGPATTIAHEKASNPWLAQPH